MMDALVRAGIRLRLLVALLALAVIAGGVLLLRDAPVDVLPEMTPPYVEIQTEALGLSAAEVEEFITVPLEANMLSGIAWVESIRSQSVPGLSSIILAFEPGTDLLRARQVVQERLTQAHTLPRVSRPPTMLQPLSSSSRVMMVGLTSDELSLIDLSVQARWNIRPRLMGVPGVANVAIWGQRERQLQVQVDPARLGDEGVTLSQVIRTTGNALWVSPLSYLNASTPGAGGFIETTTQRFGVRHILPITTAEDLARVRIEDSSLLLGDVAEVVEDHQPLIGSAQTPRGEGLLLVVERLPGTDVLDVTAGVEEALQALAAGLEGVDIDATIYRADTFVNAAAMNVGLALIIGLVLLAVVLLILGFDWRRILVATGATSLSVIVGALVLHLAGGSVNSIVIAGLLAATAIVLSDGLLQLQAIQERLEATPAGGPDATAAGISQATTEAREGGGYALLIALLVIIPILALDGLARALLSPLAFAFAISITASFVIGYLVTPALAVLVLRPTHAHSGVGLIARAEPRYARLLAHLMPKTGIAAIVAFAIVLVGIATVPFLQAGVTPEFAERDLVVSLDSASGTSQPATRQLIDQVRTDLLTIPEVRDVGGHVGRAVLSDQVDNVDSSQLWVSLEPTAAIEAATLAVRQVMERYVEHRPVVETYLGQRTTELEPPRNDEIVVRLFGPLPEVLESQAAAVAAAMGDVPGVTASRVEPMLREPQIEVEVDLAAAARHGLKPGDIRRAASTLISGIEVGSLFEDQKVFEVVVWGVPALRQSVDSLAGLLIDTPDGGHVTLGEVAEIRLDETYSVINREGISRVLDVVATVDAADAVATSERIGARLQELTYPLEYHAELDDAAIGARAVRDRALSIAAAVLVAIVLLFQAAFNSWRLALLALIVPASAAAGGLLAALAMGGVVSVGVVAGILALGGISAAMAVRQVGAYRRLADATPGVPEGEQLVNLARRQVGGHLIAVLPVAAFMLPFALIGNVPGLEITRPLTIVLLAGLLAATLVSALVLPALYSFSGLGARMRGATVPTDDIGKPDPAGNA